MAQLNLQLSAEPTGPSLIPLAFPLFDLMRDSRCLPYAILAPRIPRTTESNSDLLIALSAPQAPFAPRIHISAPLINGLDSCPNTFFVFTWPDGVQRNAVPRRRGRGGDVFERRWRHGATVGVAVGGDFLAEEDAQDGDGGTNDGDGGFNGRPDGDVFAVIGEVGLPQLNYVDAFYNRTDTGSGLQLAYDRAK